MIDTTTISLALGGGAVASLIFLAGLWITVRRLPHAKHPALVAFASMTLRLGAVLGVFYLISRSGSYVAVLIALGVFVVSRLVTARMVGRRSEDSG